MFKNYHEFYVGVVDFYSASLYGPNEGSSNVGLDARATPWHAAANLTQRKISGQLSNVSIGGVSTSTSISDGGSGQHSKQYSEALKSRLESGLAGLGEYLRRADGRESHAASLEGALEPDLGSRLADGRGGEITIGSFNRLELSDAAHIICVFLLLVLAKRLLVRHLANWRWLARARLRPQDRERLDECVWRLGFYSFSSAWLVYTCFIKHNSHLLFLPTTDTDLPGHSSSQSSSSSVYSFEVDWWSYTICMIETAFYVHATYALVWEDVWRRDSPMMLVHHLAAIFSLFSVYSTRLHQIGLAATVLRDTCDVLLELTKLLKCLHIQRGRKVASLGLAIKCCLAIFTLAFAVNQLYYYPLFCFYHVLNVIKVYGLQTPVMVGIITCGLTFLLLDCLWFLLILRLLYYIVLSGGKLKDIREYEDDDDDEEEKDLVRQNGPDLTGSSNNKNENKAKRE